MKLPPWVLRELDAFPAPDTGRVTITLEWYSGGVSMLELGRSVRLRPQSVRVTPPTGQFAVDGKAPEGRGG